MRQMSLRRLAIATSTIAFATVFSVGWSHQGGFSVSVDSAQAQNRINVYRAFQGRPSNYARFGGGVPWYVVRAYYMGGPWSGVGGNGLPYHWNGWADYAAQNGIGCTPGTPVKAEDGIDYACQ